MLKEKNWMKWDFNFWVESGVKKSYMLEIEVEICVKSNLNTLCAMLLNGLYIFL